jgi:pyruvate,water dikinase
MSAVRVWTPLADARPERSFGGKVAGLAGSAAVRSSAIGEDSCTASFAGQHDSLINVYPDELADAVHAVWRSATSEGALAYRRHRGLDGSPRIGVVVQQFVAADVAGVMFTQNPMSGAAERWIEASWGLGEAVVGGRVIPDRYCLSVAGDLLEAITGHKELAIAPRMGGGYQERRLDRPTAERRCLSEPQLGQLHLLACACEAAFGDGQDIEWAFTGADPHLVQIRPLTASVA